MSLTGRAIILLSAALTILVAAATVFLWRRGGRLRPPIRVAGLLTVEVLVVLTAGLIVNRSERFYPSWQALAASHSTENAAKPPVGRLDGVLASSNVVRWSPPEESGWRLAAPPVLIVSADYARHAGRSYPVIVVLTSADRVASIRAEAASITDALIVVAVPTRGTTAADLTTLPARLAQDARAADTGWAIVADTAQTTLARRWHNLVPARFRLVTNALATAADRLPPSLNAPVRLHP